MGHHVAVLYGGTSSEREISLKTGRAVSNALRESGHRVTEVDVKAEDGSELKGLKVDVVFIALHGRFGEDGQLQRLLEQRQIPYTGSGPIASRNAMDKLESKRKFLRAGIDTPAYQVLSQGDSLDVLEQCGRSLGYPLVIKPRSEGSSVGVTIHPDRSTLQEGADGAFLFGRTALMEQFIAGREMTVGILDNRALPLVELKPRREFFDYDAKYRDPDTQYIVNPDLPRQDRAAIQGAALKAHRTLRCEGASRVDVIFTPRLQVYVLEVNTIPGMTERSLLPRAAAAEGITYPQLCDQLVRMAFTRERETGSWVAAALL